VDTLNELEKMLPSLSRGEKAQLLKWVVQDVDHGQRNAHPSNSATQIKLRHGDDHTTLTTKKKSGENTLDNSIYKQ
jgi:hypothetical protein